MLIFRVVLGSWLVSCTCLSGKVLGGVAKNAHLIDDFATILDPGPLYYSASDVDVNVIVLIIS